MLSCAESAVTVMQLSYNEVLLVRSKERRGRSEEAQIGSLVKFIEIESIM